MPEPQQAEARKFALPAAISLDSKRSSQGDSPVSPPFASAHKTGALTELDLSDR
jgi:hypothetical protein